MIAALRSSHAPCAMPALRSSTRGFVRPPRRSPRVVELIRAKGMDDVLVIGGGVIPEGDIPALKAAGIAEVFTPGTPTSDVVNFIKEHVKA